jgi:hypothetical protein
MTNHPFRIAVLVSVLLLASTAAARGQVEIYSRITPAGLPTQNEFTVQLQLFYF